MDQHSLTRSLAGLPIGEMLYFDSIGSTNDEASRRAAAGAPDLTLVVAAEQTAGRGRAGRRWFTPAGAALAFTLLLRPAEPAAVTHYAGLGALAVCSTLRQDYGLEAQIKWPNDVLLEGQKVAGVLVEMQWIGDSPQAVWVGVGVNLSPRSVPDPALVAYPATCIEAFTQHPLQAETVLRQILGRLLGWREQLGGPGFLAAWQEHLAWKGQRVVVQDENGIAIQTGWLEGLSPGGGLLLRDAGAGVIEVVTGDLRLRLDAAVDSRAEG